MRAGALACALLLTSACLADPQRGQMNELLERLVVARAALAQQPPQLDDACESVGYVGSRLSGEPGLVDVRPAWPALRHATDALLAVCGHGRLLEQPFEPTAAMLSARRRWQQGSSAELESACAYLQDAARALGQSPRCA